MKITWYLAHSHFQEKRMSKGKRANTLHIYTTDHEWIPHLFSPYHSPDLQGMDSGFFVLPYGWGTQAHKLLSISDSGQWQNRRVRPGLGRSRYLSTVWRNSLERNGEDTVGRAQGGQTLASSTVPRKLRLPWRAGECGKGQQGQDRQGLEGYTI